jgi:hypothetical protein
MLDILKFVLSGPWVFIGTVILLFMVAVIVSEIFPLIEKEVNYYGGDCQDNRRSQESKESSGRGEARTE